MPCSLGPQEPKASGNVKHCSYSKKNKIRSFLWPRSVPATAGLALSFLWTDPKTSMGVSPNCEPLRTAVFFVVKPFNPKELKKS